MALFLQGNSDCAICLYNESVYSLWCTLKVNIDQMPKFRFDMLWYEIFPWKSSFPVSTKITSGYTASLSDRYFFGLKPLLNPGKQNPNSGPSSGTKIQKQYWKLVHWNVVWILFPEIVYDDCRMLTMSDFDSRS